MKNTRVGILIAVAVVALLLVLALVAPSLVQKHPSPSKNEAQSTTDKSVKARGAVESSEEVVLSSQIAGMIKKIIVHEGDSVHRDEVIVIFDDAQITAQHQQAQAQLASASSRVKELTAGSRREDIAVARANLKRTSAIFDQAKEEYERQERLLAKEATTEVEVRRAEERMKAAEADSQSAEATLQKLLRGERPEEIEQAKAQQDKARSETQFYAARLKDYTIRSPIDGLVIERNKEPGETVDIGTPVLKLINPKKLRIRAELEESDVGKVQERQTVEVTTDSLPGKTFTGKVEKVFPTIKKREQKKFDPIVSFDINTQKIHVVLDNYTGLRNGMTVKVRFVK